MPLVFVYEQTGASNISTFLGGMPAIYTTEPSAALSYCYASHQIGIIVLEMERLHPTLTDRSAQELLFFDEVNLMHHGVPLVIVAPHPELFLPDLKRFKFDRLVDLDFMMQFIAKKKEQDPHRSLGEYGAFAIGVQTPIHPVRFRALIEAISQDLESVKA